MGSESVNNRFRFNLLTLMTLVTSSCLVAALSGWWPQAAAFTAPPILGPVVACSQIPTPRVAILGLISAYFWCFAIVLPLGWIPEVVDHFYVPAIIVSLLGGYLAAKIEQSRLEHLRRKRLREQRAESNRVRQVGDDDPEQGRKG